MGRKTTMARNPRKVVALGNLHAHPPPGHGVPARSGRRDRPVAGRAPEATPGRRTRSGGIHLVLSRRPGPGGERDSRAPISVLSAPLGAPDARRGRARPDAAARPSGRGVAISSYTADELRELVQVPIEVIPYTTSLPTPAPRAGHRTAGAPLTVLFVGRLVERKGVGHLVDAASRLLPSVDVR